MATIELDQSYAGDVALYDGVHDDGEVMRRCRLFTLGTDVDLRKLDEDQGRYVQIDRMTNAEAEQLPDGRIRFSGNGGYLTDTVGTTDNRVEWVLSPKGCKTCG